MKEDLKTTKPGMGEKHFVVLTVCILLGLTIAYPLLREGASWPLVIAALVWFIPLFAFEYWALGKYRRMKQTGSKRKQLRG